MMLRQALLILSFAMFCAPVATAQTQAFEAGQVWSLNAPLAPTARVRIGRVIGDVIHVSIWGQPMPEGVHEPFVVIHTAFERENLAASVDALVEDQPPSLVRNGFENGFRLWRAFPGNEPHPGTVKEFLDGAAQVPALADAQTGPANPIPNTR
jgi:hypothetical protein